MQKVLKLSFLAMILMVGFSLINTLQVQALTIANQNGIPSACPDKAPNNTGTCTVFINSITVNGFVDNDIRPEVRYEPILYGYIKPGETINIQWTDNVDFYSSIPVSSYIVKYGCGNSIDLANDDHIITDSAGWPHSTTWTVPNSVSNYQYCKIWVYAKGIMQSYQPTLGVSNTRAFTIQAPLTKYTCNANYQCVVASNGEYTSSNTCQNNCIAPIRYSCNTNTYQCYQTTYGTYATYNDCVIACQPPLNCSITNFSANPTDVNSGGFTYLSWNTNNNCNSCTASANPYNASWTGIENTAGGTQFIANLIQTTTFTLNCSGSANTDTRNVTVTVQTPPPVRYSCNTSTYRCYQATFGTYGSYNDCVNACQLSQICTPGTTRSCTTYESCPGTQTCNTYGTGWGTCIDTPNDGCPVTQICTPGAIQPCTINNCPGTQTCNTYGSGWNACVDNPNDNCPVIQTCIPGAIQTCTVNNCPGTQACNVYGTGWNACVDTPNDNCPIITQQLSVSCYASPNPSQVNQTVTFYSNVSGGSGSYTYSWSNYASGNNSFYQTTFGYAGTYTAYLTVSDSYGRSGSTTCNATVYGQSVNAPTLSFWADNYTLSQGGSTYLRWTSNNANYCVASNGWSGNKSLSNYESTAPNSQTTYTLTCYGNGGQVTQSLTLYVTSPTTTLSFTKLGRNLSNGDRVYSKVIRVAQGDIIEFYLTVTAGSANDLSNVVITDNLPSVFSYQSGTTKVNNITQADGIATTGLSLGTIPRNTSKIVTFQALSNNPGTYFTYTNTAQVTASGISALSDSATITFSSVLGAATVQTGAEDSLLISLLMSIGLAFLVWYYVKFNPQGKLVFARIESKIRDLHLEYLRKQIKR
jgi:uncharacterized repeat protein (TIGR01451 family)